MKYSNKRSKSKNRRKSKRGGSLKGAKILNANHYGDPVHNKTIKNPKNRVQLKENPIPGRKNTKKHFNIPLQYEIPITKFQKNNKVKYYNDKPNTVKSAPLLTKCSYEPNEDTTKPGLVGTFKIEVDKTMKGGNDVKLTVCSNYNHIQPLDTYLFLIRHLHGNESQKPFLIEMIRKIMHNIKECGRVYHKGIKFEDYDSTKFTYNVHFKYNGDIIINVEYVDENTTKRSRTHSTLHDNNLNGAELNSKLPDNVGKTHIKYEESANPPQVINGHIIYYPKVFIGLEWRLCAEHICREDETTSKLISPENVNYNLEFQLVEPIDPQYGYIKTCLRNIMGEIGLFLQEYFRYTVQITSEYKTKNYQEQDFLRDRLSDLCYDINVDYGRTNRPAIRRNVGRRDHTDYRNNNSADKSKNWKWEMSIPDNLEEHKYKIRPPTNELTEEENQKYNNEYRELERERVERESNERKRIEREIVERKKIKKQPKPPHTRGADVTSLFNDVFAQGKKKPVNDTKVGVQEVEKKTKSGEKKPVNDTKVGVQEVKGYKKPSKYGKKMDQSNK